MTKRWIAPGAVLLLTLVCCSGSNDDNERTASEQASLTSAACNTTYKKQSTSSASAYSSYACAPSVTMGGGEWIGSFTAPTSGDVVLSAANFSDYPFLVVLSDSGTGVNPANCVAANYYAVRFTATAGQKYYFVVDHPSTGTMSFDLQVEPCPAPATESNYCADGFDNDANQKVDCGDPACATYSTCAARCSAVGTISCGTTLVAGSTSQSGSTDVVSQYSCNLGSSWTPNSPEYAYVFQPTSSGVVNFTLSDFGQYPLMYVLEDDGTGCNPYTCVAGDFYSVKFNATAGKTYYLVTDGHGGTPYSYRASLICNPPATETGLCTDDIDNDGNGLIDCADPACKSDPACASTSKCVPVTTIGCSTLKMHDSTSNAGSTDVISTYACDPKVTWPDSERAYTIGPMAATTPMVVTLSNESAYAGVMILKDSGTGCDPSSCTYEQYYSARFTATKGNTYYAVIEPHAATTVDYDLTVICNPPANEAGLCTDGIDNDGNGFIDCADSACASDPACVVAPTTTITSSTQLLSGDTTSGTNVIQNYGCAPDLATPGNEYGYTFTAPSTGRYNFTLSKEDNYALISVLNQVNGKCNPSACVAEQFYSTVTELTGGQTYCVVVDAPQAGAVSYDISVVPNPPATEKGFCSDGIDNDGNFYIDSADPNCP